MSRRTLSELADICDSLCRTATLNLQQHEREALFEVVTQLRKQGNQMDGWAMKHWDGYVFGRTEFDDGQGVPASLTLYGELNEE